MYIFQCTPFVTIVTRAPYHGRLQIHFRAWLQCPFCRNVIEEISNPEVLPKPGQPKLVARSVGKTEIGHLHDFTIEEEPNEPDYPIGQYIAHAIQMIRQHRACKHCGVVSGVPELDVESIKKNLEQQVNSEWLRQEVQACAVSPTGFRADEDAQPNTHDRRPSY